MKESFIKRFIFLTLLMLSLAPLSAAPSSKDVEDNLDSFKEKREKDNRNRVTNRDFLRKLFSRIKITKKNAKTYFIVIAILFISIIVYSIAFFLIRQSASTGYAAQRLDALKEEHREHYFEEGKLNRLIKERNFSEAVVYLHRCTIFYLIKQGIVFNKNTTNFSLYGRIREQNRREAFRNIYLVAEMVLFDEYSADEQEFANCKSLYYENFLNG